MAETRTREIPISYTVVHPIHQLNVDNQIFQNTSYNISRPGRSCLLKAHQNTLVCISREIPSQCLYTSIDHTIMLVKVGTQEMSGTSHQRVEVRHQRSSCGGLRLSNTGPSHLYARHLQKYYTAFKPKTPQSTRYRVVFALDVVR